MYGLIKRNGHGPKDLTNTELLGKGIPRPLLSSAKANTGSAKSRGCHGNGSHFRATAEEGEHNLVIIVDRVSRGFKK